MARSIPPSLAFSRKAVRVRALGRRPWTARLGCWVGALALVGGGGAEASLDTYDAGIAADAAAGLTPLARLEAPVLFSGAGGAAFDFGAVAADATFEFILAGEVADTSVFLAVGSNSASSLRFAQWPGTGQLGFTQLGAHDYLFSPGVPAPAAPTHLAYVWNAAARTMKLYAGGALAGSVTGVEPGFAMPRGAGWLGANPSGTEALRGTVYRVTVYDAAISGQVIQRHAEAYAVGSRLPHLAEMSVPGGVFREPFSVLLQTAEVGAEIRYTLDGSTPGPAHGTVYAAPIPISTTTHLRAVVLANGQASAVTGASYLRLASDLLNYTSTLPLMVIDNFGAGTIPQKGWSSSGAGIRQVPRQTAAWALFERADGQAALTHAPQLLSLIGVRGRGAYSTEWRQKPYSVEAVDEAGAERPVAPLGMPAHADWVLYYPDPASSADPTLLFNTFAYALSASCGDYAVRFRWVEAFVNEDGGDLSLADRRGVYALLERPTRGKNRLDFQRLSADGSAGGWLLNINRMDPEPELGWPAPNGAVQPWFFHTAGANRTVETAPNTAYNPVPGDDQPRQWNAYLNFDNPNGYVINLTQRAAIEDWFRQFEDVLYDNARWRDPTNGYRRYLEVADFVDYFLLNTLTRNGDGLLISLFPWKGDDGRLRIGPAWDYNWSSYYISGGPTGSLLHRADRLWYGRLFADPDFLQAFIDRWWALRRGPLRNDALTALIDAQAGDIGPEKALLNGLPSAEEWASRLTQMKDWLRQRADWIDGNLLSPPTFNRDGGDVPDGFEVVLNATRGTLYFTSDGLDPRAAGGGVAASAQAYARPFTVRAPTLVNARALDGTNWSGLAQATFTTPQDLSPLRFTEIMYHPPVVAGGADGDLEFVELWNSGTQPLQLGTLTFTAGLAFTFTNGTRLDAGAYCVLVRNEAAFHARYSGVPVHGVFAGRLDDSGERLRLSTGSGGTVLEVEYNDRAPWPLAADGYGFSIVPAEPAKPLRPDDGARWRASGTAGGSPGMADPPAPTVAVRLNEVLTHTFLPAVDAVELYNPSDQPADVSGWFLSDDGAVPLKYRIPAGTVIPAGGYGVFTEAEFNAAPNSLMNFAFDSAGDAVYLTAADAAGNLLGYGHGLDFGAAPAGVSFGRYVNSVGEEQFPLQAGRTLGGPNAGPALGPVVIAEIHYQAPVAGEEFVELRNLTDQPVPLFDPAHRTNTWRLAGAGLVFPTNLALPARGLLLVAATNETAFRARFSVPAEVPVLSASGATWRNAAGHLELRRPDAPETNGVSYYTVDAVSYLGSAPWPPAANGGGASLQRNGLGTYGNDPAHWVAAAPTPGTDRPDVAPRFATIELGAAAVTLRFPAEANRRYTVEFTDALESGLWQGLADVPAQGAETEAAVTDTRSAARRFYRLLAR